LAERTSAEVTELFAYYQLLQQEREQATKGGKPAKASAAPDAPALPRGEAQRQALLAEFGSRVKRKKKRTE